MRFAVLGTGQVGMAIASKLAQLDHDVMTGARSTTNESSAAMWAVTNGLLAGQGTFADPARDGEIVVNATAGSVSLLQAFGTANAIKQDSIAIRR
jgi:8-hydroxy-5-deazaflavin:NADPH oxidoreductase